MLLWGTEVKNLIVVLTQCDAFLYLVFHFLFSIVSFSDKVLFCSPVCPGVYHVDQAGLKLSTIFLLRPPQC